MSASGKAVTGPLKLPRTIRLDPSDTFVFRQPASPGEWAVTGSFLFAGAEPDALDAKARAAFRAGFLGIDSFGWSTLVVVTEVTPDELEAATGLLATRLVEKLGAPSMAEARLAAAEELAFAASLCDHPPQTLLALSRGLEHGELHERFRTLTPRGERPKPGLMEGFRAFEIVDDEDAMEEQVDLIRLGDLSPVKGTSA